MKKKLLLLATSVCIVGALSGCSKKNTYSEYMELGEYKGLEVNMIKSEVTEDMVQEEVDTLLEDHSTYTEITDRPAQEGDTLNIDYEGTIEGEPFEEGSAEDFDVELGSGYLMEELETALVGTTVGETKQIPVTFTEDYDESLEGKEAVFTVKVNSISEKEIPEYNDEFISTVSDFSTVSEYEDNLSKELLASLEEENRYTAGTDALSAVVENTSFSGYPQELYDSCKETYDATNQMYAEMFGMDVSDFELSEEETKSAVEEMVYEKMVAQAIAEAEGLKVSDKEYKDYLEQNYEDYGYDSPESYEESETKDAIMNEIQATKVQDFLLDNAKITEVSEDEYYESDDGEDIGDLEDEE